MSPGHELELDKHLESDLVDVEVIDHRAGSSVTFRLHESLLRAKTNLFKGPAAPRQFYFTSYPIDSFQNYVSWLTHGYTDHFVLDVEMWRIADTLGSTDLQNSLVDNCQTWDFDHHFLWFLCDFRAWGFEYSTLAAYLQQKVAYEILRQGLSAILDIAEGRGQWIKDGEYAFEDIDKVKLMTLVSDDLMYAYDAQDVQDPAEHEGCEWHLHPTEESKKKCPRYRSEA